MSRKLWGSKGRTRVSEGRLGESVLGGNSRNRGAETQMWGEGLMPSPKWMKDQSYWSIIRERRMVCPEE